MPSFCAYEHVIYLEDTDRLTKELILICQETSRVPDKRVRQAILVSSILTLIQVLDGQDMPKDSGKFIRGGVADRIRDLLNKC